MTRPLLKLLAVAALSVPAVFGTNLTVSLGNSPFPNGIIGPYIANVEGMKDFVYCDDDTHTVYPNETWTATATSLSSLVALGNNNVAANSNVMWKSLTSAVTLYQEAAWLIYQFPANSADTSGLQNAIWDLFLGKSGTGSVSNQSTDTYWLAQASTNFTRLTSSQLANTIILTPVAGTQTAGYGLPQEFITTTPEPASMAMMGMGVSLLLLGSFCRWKSRRA